MPGNDNPHALRLHSAIVHHAGTPAAEAFMQAHPLPKSAAPERKHGWACAVCRDMEAAFGEGAPAIRRDCRCNDGRTMAQEIARCLAKAGSLAEGCALFTAGNRYAFLEYVSEHEVIFGYHACVCSCVKRAEGAVPLLWCECSCGYAEAMFTQVFGPGVQVALLGSVISGDERCAMRVRIP